jgi:hypothetical protein
MAGGVLVSVRSDMKRTVAEFRLERSKINKAVMRALNRAQDKVATETGREIRKEYNVKQRAIRSALRKRRAAPNHHMARLIIEGVRLGLIEFAARWRPGQTGGATVKIKVKGARKVVRGAFIGVNSETGYRGVFRRVGREQYPIRNLRSISVPQAFSNKAVLAALEKYATDTFNKNLQQQLRYLSGIS